MSAGKKENKLGMRASDTSEVVFEDCRMPASQLLGEEGQGFINTLQVLDAGRIGIAALSVGLAQGAYEAARNYAKERRQFGQPIAAFQAIQWKLADMATQIDAARLLTYRAAYLKDQGRRMTRESAMAKLYASEVAVQGRRRLRPDPRRLRLREGLSGREVLPRREALHDRRGHERDPAARDRAAAARSDAALIARPNASSPAIRAPSPARSPWSRTNRRRARISSARSSRAPAART